MNELIKFDDDVNNKIITIRNQKVILDFAVAALYGVETKRVNEAIRNNPDKFPRGYVFELKPNEFHAVRSKISTATLEQSENQYVSAFMGLPANLEKTRIRPKAFTEKGLYMLATILKSPRATQATIEIVEAFAKLKELSNNLIALSSMEEETIEPEVLESTGGLFKDLFSSMFPQSSAETSLEVNLGIMKLKREVKNENPNIVHNQNIQQRFDELEKIMLEIKNRIETTS